MKNTLELTAALRHPQAIQAMASAIGTAATMLETPLHIMEICGGHTHSIMKYGIDTLMPENIRFAHGPGCPVCVLPKVRVDHAICMATQPDTILVCLGDMMRVPGSGGQSLQHVRADGADVRFVYSPLDVLPIAAENPGKTVVFFAIGFETTTPTTASLLHTVQANNLSNIVFHINHVMVPPAVTALLQSGSSSVNAFIVPGHVSAISGWKPYEKLAEEHQVPFVVSGFEPVDILAAVRTIVTQSLEKKPAAHNDYRRVVSYEGNSRARELVDLYFEPRSTFPWRGLGDIPASALQLRERFRHLDAEILFQSVLPENSSDDHRNCLCGAILRGVALPGQCQLFGRQCTPSNPQGSCMVSSEGACAAYYKYRGEAL